METLSRHGVRPSREAGWMCWAAWSQPLPLQIAPPAGPMNLASEALVVLIPSHLACVDPWALPALASWDPPASCIPEGLLGKRDTV